MLRRAPFLVCLAAALLVAVLPFYNQSAEPTVDGEAIAVAYYNELQAIPGFEVVPVGVSRRLLDGTGLEPRSPEEFQKLARMMGVDAVLVGSITEYSPYYPPRIGLSVDWYAANPGFHPIPAGYGLPWNTPQEEFIPTSLVQEAEFALAREQLKTQSPEIPAEIRPRSAPREGAVEQAKHTQAAPESLPAGVVDAELPAVGAVAALPAEWPNPRGFVPSPPSPTKPPLRPQFEPVISHTKVYHGNDGDLTRRLENYFYFRDDARFGGWQAYLQRPEDFVRFCCHLHITETLVARGGAGESRVVYRWPIRRYHR